MIIEAKRIHKDYGGSVVLDGAELAVAPGEKVGLIGRNGAGKSTLIRILAGVDDDFTGTVALAPGRSLAVVPQYFPDRAGTAADFLSGEALALRGRLRAAEVRLAEAPADRLDAALAEYARLREAYDAMDGDGAEAAADRFLATIGLAAAAGTPCVALSGGERNVLALGRALLARSDLLILDEPGNHLDAWGLAWLEQFLAGIPQAVLIVSHNRYLLDRTVSRVVELEAGRTASYPGGYSAYRMEKLRRSAAQGADWQADRKRLERLEDLVKRFREIASSRPDPAWGKRLRARVSQLERAKAVAVEKPVGDGRRISAEFKAEASKADIAAAVTGYDRSVPGRAGAALERVLFAGAGLLIRTGERVGLVGPNGSGKSTFLADLVGRGRWDDPVLRIGPSLTVGYCAQHQEVFDPAATVRDEFLKLGAFTEDDVFGCLRRFLFGRADLDKKVGDLSGGERNRLQLARAVRLGADFLILDEPTNHLDIPAREAVEEALSDFAGTLFVVSHDRTFLDRLVDRVVEIDQAGFVSWDGNFTEFWFRSGAKAALDKAGAGRPGSSGKPGSGIADRGRAKAAAAAAGGKGVPQGGGGATADSGRAAVLAARIERLEAERAVLEKRAAAALAAGGYAEARKHGNAIAGLAKTIERLYADWAG